MADSGLKSHFHNADFGWGFYLCAIDRVGGGGGYPRKHSNRPQKLISVSPLTTVLSIIYKEIKNKKVSNLP